MSLGLETEEAASHAYTQAFATRKHDLLVYIYGFGKHLKFQFL